MFSYLIQYPHTAFLPPSSYLNKYIHKMSLKYHILFHRSSVLFLKSVAKIADNMKTFFHPHSQEAAGLLLFILVSAETLLMCAITAVSRCHCTDNLYLKD